MNIFSNYKVILYIHLWIIQQAVYMTDSTAIKQRDISNGISMEDVRSQTNPIADQRRNILCGNSDTTGDMVLLEELSLCPWTTRVDENRYRQPIRITQAECAFGRPTEMPGLVCRPVYRDMTVTILNSKVIERVAVACTAVPICI
ncbi:uncharacterized protein LOC125665467 [Ostrea edulis]|uniref:uncharacterized protein LOC125665467 n=1 Tax=Ostrea edulis TaxID=37623 RepID=UPI00209605DD|nr:uncharacterized protein LOC125665467 [Ostrea edulis]